MNSTSEIRVLDILLDTTVDGPGFRTSIYCAGCAHHCSECHNPQSWSFSGGRLYTVNQLLQVILDQRYADVTFSGGDPFYQAQGFAELARKVKMQSQKTIWCYTGFLYEDLLRLPSAKDLLTYIDVLVDGPFVQRLYDPDLPFRGSSNQRIIDVPRSLQADQVLEYNM